VKLICNLNFHFFFGCSSARCGGTIVSGCERSIGIGGAGGVVFEGHSIGGGLYVHGFGGCIVLGDDTKHVRIARVRKRVKEIVVVRIGELWSRSGWSFIGKRGGSGLGETILV
jgi:hypothetical protein